MMGRGRARATKDKMSLVARCSVFKDHSAGSTGLAASSPLASVTKKAPRREGPDVGAGCPPAEAGLLATRLLLSKTVARATKQYSQRFRKRPGARTVACPPGARAPKSPPKVRQAAARRGSSRRA